MSFIHLTVDQILDLHETALLEGGRQTCEPAGGETVIDLREVTSYLAVSR